MKIFNKNCSDRQIKHKDSSNGGIAVFTDVNAAKDKAFADTGSAH